MASSESGAEVVSTRTRGSSGKSRLAKSSEQRSKQAQQTSILLKHASDATRLQIVAILAEGERHVGDLSETLNQSQPAVSHHLALMRHGGIVVSRRQGKNNYYSLSESGERLAQVVQTLLV